MARADIPSAEAPGRWHRAAMSLLGPVCGLALLLACYRAVLLDGEQFAYRDAAHYYYPLYLRVQQEWQAGRWPLWDPGQNGGQPLLGNPMAAVLYPGKLLYALLPYAWAARLYVVAHTALAFVGMTALARSWRVSRIGASLSGLSYAFGAPVLFQYCNVIFLVGAAWVPWGLRAIDRLVRLRRRSGAPELAVVLALQVLGGDPQAAYPTVVCGAGYAAILAWPGCRRPGRIAAACALTLVAWAAVTLGLAYRRTPIPGWSGPIWVPAVFAWGGAAGWILWRWWRSRGGELGPRLAGLIGAGVLAMALAAAQLLPVAEFSRLSSRLDEENPIDPYPYSLEPYRLAESLWPGAFGPPFPEQRSWIQALPPAGDRFLWEPSLYVGGLALVLSLGAIGFRGGPPWRVWLTLIATVSLLASFGKFGGPLWWARWIPGVESVLGPHDPKQHGLRVDGFLGDGTGSPYGGLAAVLPGFGLFRYPSKLLTFTAAAVAGLAGLGWDDLAAGRSRRLARASLLGLVAGLVAVGLALALRAPIVAWLSGRIPPYVDTGPAEVSGAWGETQRALAHGVVICAVGLGLARWGPRRPLRAGAVAVLVLAADLGLANARLIWTVPQSVFESEPEVARRIAAAERAAPSAGPFRIHRMNSWFPQRFSIKGSPERSRELVAWQRGTLKALHALPVGLEYAVTPGALELDDSRRFFYSEPLPATEAVARALGVPPGRPIHYHPRRSFDLWGARYFIVPARADDWGTEDRGLASFLFDTEVIHPTPAEMSDASRRRLWEETEDWQLLRNNDAYPRAWLVHDARIVPPATSAGARFELMHHILFQNDPIWSDPERPVSDLRAMAWIEADDPDALRGSISRAAVGPEETVTVVRHEPQRVELSARLVRPGLVILADAHYPGWRLTIDGRPAPILRANRLMRGAAVPAGEHTLVYVFDPPSFRIGLVLSLVGLAALLTLLVRHSRPGVIRNRNDRSSL